jgi:hypothetical protein
LDFPLLHLRVRVIFLLSMTSSLLHSRECRSVPRRPWPGPQNPILEISPNAARSSQHHKLVQNLIDHQQLLYRTRPNLGVSSNLINPPQIHCRSSPSRGRLQITSSLVPKSPFRYQVQTTGKPLRHAEDMKPAASLTQNTQ